MTDLFLDADLARAEAIDCPHVGIVWRRSYVCRVCVAHALHDERERVLSEQETARKRFRTPKPRRRVPETMRRRGS